MADLKRKAPGLPSARGFRSTDESADGGSSTYRGVGGRGRGRGRGGSRGGRGGGLSRGRGDGDGQDADKGPLTEEEETLFNDFEESDEREALRLVRNAKRQTALKAREDDEFVRKDQAKFAKQVVSQLKRIEEPNSRDVFTDDPAELSSIIKEIETAKGEDPEYASLLNHLRRNLETLQSRPAVRTPDYFRNKVYTREELTDMMRELAETPDEVLDLRYDVLMSTYGVHPSNPFVHLALCACSR